MKTLYLVRHAKSSWAFDLHDHDRPLGKRGRKDVRKIGKHLAKHHQSPEVLISSTASRAFYTTLFICDQMGIDEGHIRLNKDLYHAGAEQILRVIQSSPNCNFLALFGHNPGFTDCANLLAGTHIDNIPTCGVIGISFDVDKWRDVQFGQGKQEFYYYPKGIEE